ncbi:MAG TPA: YetF domain-containing protein [Pyrinomonadaceae bacterium]|nr:YetF domain-containing protein [Pyrinomonadaceae bacterium]
MVEPAPLPLIKHGRLLRRNMRHELITEAELMGQLRKQGVADVSKVKEAHIESDGQVSVIQYEEKQHSKVKRKGS